MKKVSALLLAILLTLGMAATFTAPAAAAGLEDITIANEITVYKGFNKKNANYFILLKLKNPDLQFTAEANDMFTINQFNGKMTFNTGLSSRSLGPVKVTVHLGEETKVVEVKALYEWYEYFVIVFAAGLFWISAVNN